MNRCRGTATAGCCRAKFPGRSSSACPRRTSPISARPRSFTAALFDFLLPKTDGSDEAGLPIRRAALGDAHVDRSLAAATDFTRDFQELITRFAWGTIWARPGLDHRTRRHVDHRQDRRARPLGGVPPPRPRRPRRGARAVRPEEVLLQVAVYAGVPAANTGFQIAAEELEGQGVTVGCSIRANPNASGQLVARRERSFEQRLGEIRGRTRWRAEGVFTPIPSSGALGVGSWALGGDAHRYVQSSQSLLSVTASPSSPSTIPRQRPRPGVPAAISEAIESGRARSGGLRHRVHGRGQDLRRRRRHQHARPRRLGRS